MCCVNQTLGRTMRKRGQVCESQDEATRARKVTQYGSNPVESIQNDLKILKIK